MISAHTELEKLNSYNEQMLKVHAFLESVAEAVDPDSISNLIVVGDSLLSADAG